MLWNVLDIAYIQMLTTSCILTSCLTCIMYDVCALHHVMLLTLLWCDTCMLPSVLSFLLYSNFYLLTGKTDIKPSARNNPTWVAKCASAALDPDTATKYELAGK